jgi:hypothetical protein
MQVTSNKSFRHVLAFHSLLPKGQTHREVGAQSHGSVLRSIITDRQTAEVLFTSAVSNYGGLERRNTSEEPSALSCIILK